MATAPKQNISISSTVRLATVTLDSLSNAKTLVGAPSDATISIGQVGPSFNEDGSLDESVGQNSVTFSWSEQK